MQSKFGATKKKTDQKFKFIVNESLLIFLGKLGLQGYTFCVNVKQLKLQFRQAFLLNGKESPINEIQYICCTSSFLTSFVVVVFMQVKDIILRMLTKLNE